MNTTANQSPLIKAQVYSEYILQQLYDGFLPEGLHRDVSDFGDGETLFIPTIGETVIRDYSEDAPIQFDPVDSGQVTLKITEYVQGGAYITDKLKQDAYALAALEAQIPDNFLRKIKEKYETDMLAAANNGQIPNNTNAVNGFDHRWVAGISGTAGKIDLDDFVYMKLAFDKANVPDEGRIAIVDPSCEAVINSFIAGQGFTNNPQFEGLVNTGFARGRKFLRNIFGWDVWVSNRLPRIDQETINGGPQGASAGVTTSTNNIANLFMCVADDQCKPVMGAWRQAPMVEGERNIKRKRDEYSVTARWGFGTQRDETLGVVVTDGKFYAA